MEKAYDRVPTKVMKWAMKKKGLSKVMVRAVKSFYDGAKTRGEGEICIFKGS